MQARNIVLSSDAVQDLRAIRQNTYDAAHSRKVADDYLKRIRRRLRHLAYTAEACPHAIGLSEAFSDYRFCPVEHHCAYFKVDGDTVYVVRILHGRQDAVRHLPRSAGSS